MGRAAAGNGNRGGPAHVRNAHRLYTRGGQAIRRRVPLLSRAKLRRHCDNIYQSAKLCWARLLLSFALWTDDGSITLVVSKKLLPLLHGRRLRNLSGAGLRSVLQTRTR